MTDHEQTPRTDGPLAGLRILEFARVIAGPYMGRLLRDLGAEVIKLETPSGDTSRQIAPRADRGMSGMFTTMNVGKRGLCIDWKAEGATDLVLDLIRNCDAVIENFRPGVLDRMGIGWERIHTVNPRAILVSINGFGHDSSLHDRRAYAMVVHAASGILDDQARYAKAPVQHIAQAYGDTTSGLHATIGLLSALHERTQSGLGQHIEVPMYDAVLATYTETIDALRDPPGRQEEDDTNGLYDAGPLGQMVVAGTERHIWAQLRQAHADLEDPTPPGADIPTKARLRRGAIEAWMAAHTDRDALVTRLGEAGIACSPIESLEHALRGPFGRERGLVVSVDDRRGGERGVVRTPYQFSRTPSAVRGSAPRRGEHNREILADVLGLDDEAVEALERSGILDRGRGTSER